MADDFLLDLSFLWIIIAIGCFFYLLIRAIQYPHEFLALFKELEETKHKNQNVDSGTHFPSLIQRFLNAAHVNQEKRPAFVHVKYTGYHRLYPQEDLHPIHGDIYYCLSMPGFFSKSRTKMHRFIWTDINHRYSINDGYLIGKLFSFLPFLSARGIRLSKSCLISYFSEAVWFPWVFNSSKNIFWESVDETTARLRVSYHPLIATLDVKFNSEGLIQSISYPSQSGAQGSPVNTCTRIASYEEYTMIHGIVIPQKIEVKQKSAHHERVEKVLMLTKISYHSDPPSQYF